MFHIIKYARCKNLPVSSSRGYHTIPISFPCIRRHGFPTSRQPGRAQNRGAKRKSAVTLDDFPTFPVTPVATDPLLTNDDENSKFKVKVKKLSTTVNFEDIDKLPQGLISFSLEPLPIEELEPALPTVLLQAHNNIRKFENCVLLTRVGGFYELYFEHADEFGPLLNLKVAQRKTGKKDSPNYVSMVCNPICSENQSLTSHKSGFPFFQLDRYLKILVQDLNRYVAIAEEFKNDAEAQSKSGGLLNDRRVTRIVTPGTLIDETFMDPFTNNYVLAVHAQEPSPDEIESTVVDESAPLRLQQPSMTIGLAWMDLSTGHFFTQKTELASLPSFLARIGPREIVLDESLRDEKTHAIFDVLADDQQIVTFASTADFRPMKDWSPMLESPITPSKAETFTHAEVAAGSILIQYVEERLQGSNMKLQPPTRQLDMMGIDKNTMRALEIKKTIRDEQLTGSLLHTVRRTVTKGGARLLDTWLSKCLVLISPISTNLA
jgi:DNA mismatch repair ATPase MutS